MNWTKAILKHILVYLFVLIPIELAGIFILAIVLPFIPKTSNELPKWLWWYNTDDGISGDTPYRLRYTNWVGSAWVRFKMRYTWLAFRNPANHFQKKVLGYTWNDNCIRLRADGPAVTDYGIPGVARRTALIASEVDDSNTLIFEYYMIKPYKIPEKLLRWLHGDDTTVKALCVRVRIGWKIGYSNIKGSPLQWVFTINPVMPYRGNV